MLYAFFQVIPQHLNFICQHFGTLCLFHLHRRVGTYAPMKMEQTECSETLAYKIQTPKNYPEESIQHSEHGENSKSRIFHTCLIHSHCARTCEFTYKIYLLLQYIQLHLAVKLVMQSQKLL